MSDRFELHKAIKSGDVPSIKSLLEEHGVDANVADSTGARPLHWAIQNRSKEKIIFLFSVLLRNDANLGAVNNAGETPLFLASKKGFIEIVRFLLTYMANRATNTNRIDLIIINRADAERTTPLYAASSAGHLLVVDLLLRYGADIEAANKFGMTPLHIAVIEKHEMIVDLLLRYGADVNAVDKFGMTPLDLAISEGHVQVAKLLLEKDVNANAVNEFGMTPLYRACQREDGDMVALLLNHGANANAVNELGMTPLDLAVSEGYVQVAKLLLEKGANANAVNEFGMTPLHGACQKKDRAMVELLLEKGADANAVNKFGLNPLYLASPGSELEALLLKHGAKYEKENKQFLTYRDDVLKKTLAPENCLSIPISYERAGRKKRNAVGEGCEISWEDVDELNEEKEKTRDLSKITINSEKFLDKLRDSGISEIKRSQLLNLANKVSVTGNEKEKGQVERLVKHHSTLMYLNKLGHVSSAVMYGMMTKNIVGDIAQGNWEGVAINTGFIAGAQGLAKVAESASAKGMQLALNGEHLLGQSLRCASSFLARGTSAFIVYDLVNQYKAYQAGNPDALVGILGDSIYLSVDGAAIGIELAEVGGLLEGVSAVTGPIGAMVGAVVFIGTDVYLAVKQADRIDALIHLTDIEKFVEGSRAFVGMQPEAHIKKLLEEKQGNEQVSQQSIEFLKNHSDFQRYILPTMEAVKEGPIDKLEIHSHNVVVLKEKKKDFKWSRTKPDIAEGSLFCAPSGSDITIPREGAYYCENAMGVEYSVRRTGNITLVDLNDGNDLVIGFPYGDHLVILGNGFKQVTLGQGDDTFLLTGIPLDSMLDGGEGTNTLDLREFACGEKVIFIKATFTLFEPINLIESEAEAKESRNVSGVILSKLEKNEYVPYLKEIIGMTKLLLRPHKQDFVTLCCDDIHYVDGRGGENDSLWDTINITRCGKKVERDQVFHYALTLIARPNTRITNLMENGNFTYIIPAGEWGRAEIKLRGYQDISHRFLFNYNLHDLSYLKVDGSEFSLGFVNAASRKMNAIESTNQFDLVIKSFNSNTFYQLSDGTELRVGAELELEDDRSFYAFQSTNRSIEEIINTDPRIAERLNLFLLVQSSLTNESVAIGHGKHDVLSNDPYRRSHLVGNGGENMFVIRSGYKFLDRRHLPVPEVVLYDKDEQNLIDTLDLREISSQLEKCFGVEINARASLSVNTNDIIVELFLPAEVERIGVTVRLKNALLTNWHKRLHILINHGVMILDGLDLKPLPLEFGPDQAIIIINPEDVEKTTTLIVPKKQGDYHYYRLGDSLILSNGDYAIESERYAVLLQSFYRTPKLETLSIQFADKKIALKSEVTKIRDAKDFVLECEQYNQMLHQVLFNKKETEARSNRHVFPIPAVEERVTRKEEDKKALDEPIWNSRTGYLLMSGMVIFGISGIATVAAVGMVGYRYLRGWRAIPSRVPSLTHKQAVMAAGISLLAERTVEANPLDKKEVNDKGSQAVKGDPSCVAFDNDSVGTVCLLKYVLHYLGWKTAVSRMNQIEVLQGNRPHGTTSVLDAVEKKVKVALEEGERQYAMHDKKLSGSLFYRGKRISRVQSVDENLKIKRKTATNFFKVPVQRLIANDSSMNISSTEQAYAIG